MKVKLWGTRGSLPSPGPETMRDGGNTCCVEVLGSEGTLLVLDAGTGIRRFGAAIPTPPKRVDVLLTHLHMDHIQGLAFFAPFRTPGVEVHIWGPASASLSLSTRLSRYLSPPLFPLFLREMGSTMILHEVPIGEFDIGEFRVDAALVCHPDTTVGYRINASDCVLTYIPDHEPALGVRDFPLKSDWTSGYELAEGANLLIHDSQYTHEEYRERVGFGHSSMAQAMQFADLSQVEHLVPFHHDPAHGDEELDQLISQAVETTNPDFQVTPGKEGATFQLGG